ncbi:type II toxin-antitoxin system YafQ family toxin [Oscillospiraceae bacterium 44-34]|jgi:mRNA interferase YafQ
MLKIRVHRLFKKDLKRIERRGYNLDLLRTTVSFLAEQKTLPEKYKDHRLTGDYTGYRECHITPDWLLVYRIDRDQLILVLTRTGTHSDLF